MHEFALASSPRLAYPPGIGWLVLRDLLNAKFRLNWMIADPKDNPAYMLLLIDEVASSLISPTGDADHC